MPGGPLDEGAHLATGALILLALGRPLTDRFGRALLAASVLIDLDHIPGQLGVDWITSGTPRPYTHSLLTLGLLAGLAIGWRRRRPEVLGALVGVAGHLYRDLAESGSGVSLLWSWSNHRFSLPHGAYLASMLMLAAVAIRHWQSRTEHTDPTHRPSAFTRARRSPISTRQ